MTRARSMCSRAFMDGKFSVLGGMDQNKKVLTFSGAAPPLVAVENIELYVAHHFADNNELSN
ncbi:F-box/kelch-repeat protein SKIP11-like [Canna indica]|uniref:F-box/kelch-repeat protein SKIP11-like n=1 Tax=Canna indica TaxID=4628 RepID=A0AAQ3L6X8_9LILI|nr:F-box/kelch-repeat protein SKIP11-like [Canna indica]